MAVDTAVREDGLRDPTVRLRSLLDFGSLRIVSPSDGSGVVWVRG